MKIVVDTREKNPIPFKEMINKKLDVGDYSIEGYEKLISIERKSPTDLFGTLGKGHKRFKKELSKSQDLEYFAIIIEGCYSHILNKQFGGSHHSTMKGYVITSILFTLHIKYNINIFFANNRREARNIIKEIFKAYLKTKRGDKHGSI